MKNVPSMKTPLLSNDTCAPYLVHTIPSRIIITATDKIIALLALRKKPSFLWQNGGILEILAHLSFYNLIISQFRYLVAVGKYDYDS